MTVDNASIDIAEKISESLLEEKNTTIEEKKSGTSSDIPESNDSNN